MDSKVQLDKSMDSHQGQEPIGLRQEEMVKSPIPNVVVSSTVDPEGEIKYPKGIKLAVIIASLAASVFLCALDETIIATAISRITDDFKALNDVGWYRSAQRECGSSYVIVFPSATEIKAVVIHIS
ncbi:hypothetical protein ACMFMG_000752 [Clarireedia jacksonii]